MGHYSLAQGMILIINAIYDTHVKEHDKKINEVAANSHQRAPLTEYDSKAPAEGVGEDLHLEIHDSLSCNISLVIQ